jgi:hypothetical protein
MSITVWRWQKNYIIKGGELGIRNEWVLFERTIPKQMD